MMIKFPTRSGRNLYGKLTLKRRRKREIEKLVL